MAFDFPNAPTTGQVYNNYTWDGEKWAITSIYNPVDAGAVRFDKAQSLTSAQMSQARANINVTKKNYIINGAMMISQENGTTAGTTTNYYPVDQWFLLVSSGSVSVSQQASRTPSGSPNRISCTVTGVAGFTLFQRLEGGRVADLMLGTGSAKTFTVQFGVNTVAGTHRVTVTPGGGGAGIVVNFTVSAGEAGTDVVKSATFSAITTGTYPTDNTCGVQLDISPTMPAGGVFQLFDVSLTEGSVAPPFQVPDYGSEILACQRYYQILARVVAYGGATFNYQGIYFLTAMRTSPSITPAWDAGGSATFDIGTTSAFFTSITAGLSGGSLKLNARL